MTMRSYRAKKGALHRVECNFDKETVKVSGVKYNIENKMPTIICYSSSLIFFFSWRCFLFSLATTADQLYNEFSSTLPAYVIRIFKECDSATSVATDDRLWLIISHFYLLWLILGKQNMAD